MRYFDWAKDNDNEGGTLFVGTKGKYPADGAVPSPDCCRFLLNKDVQVPKNTRVLPET
jgi:hypothetical protein